MKKLFFILFTLGTVFTFTACGSDDDPVPVDYTLYDKSEIIGIQNGKVDISLSLGTYTPYNDEVAKTQFMTSTSNSGELNLFVGPPNEIGGPITTSNFKKSTDGTYYTFDFATLAEVQKSGNEIPAYITDWYSTSNPTKIVIKNLTSTDAKYNKASKTISFTLKGALEIYTKNAEGEESKVGDNTITYKFKELVK
ncbi:hypothetical protein M2451_000111 [Dysgonomonas sp. PFB1-18]|uniref:hypothetical protein n=1 Tax=unclassified Dysgonomonas TaxID=2630389 RepID=UPI002475BC56|nr:MULTISPECIES: hypothetical protein [unclassified Dysgonomonas]MDH6307662.1 hypothetical protein [Dysgonomonas sp. PF1-14]MDH6337580.1 hypothetical protein [Dysgonomonas sp. PF1-16]MDH6378804.1 hypothetical protein [Dysgonomonas sp. PFB1-18]MDH6396439.1 hypothetical protein [Dysgonomonas sp. PF1-23]